MADRWASATGNYSFRFFSPEQVDRILREGVKRGRTGSHSAIERILKHEPGLGRAELWRRIRQLKQPSNGKVYQRTAWTEDDDRILLAMAGYKTAEFIAKALYRSENAVRYRLAVLGKSSRVHLEGYAR